MSQVEITLQVDCELTEVECWPDGEPDEWTAQSVFDVLKVEGVNQWDLLAYGIPVCIRVEHDNGEVTTAKGTVRL